MNFNLFPAYFLKSVPPQIKVFASVYAGGLLPGRSLENVSGVPTV